MASLTAAFYKHIWKPSESNLVLHSSDYGHGYYYEEVFCKDQQDIKTILRTCLKDPDISRGVLDLAGGAGRVAAALAKKGVPTILIDQSESMLELARSKRESLGTRATLLRIERASLEKYEPRQKFQWVLSINNGFEHLANRSEIISALINIRSWLHAEGTLVVDVHNPTYWQGLENWAKDQWRYWDSPQTDKGRAHMWMRTSQSGSSVTWEHAIAVRSLKYRHLKTRIQMFDLKDWLKMFEESGYEVSTQWGNWKKAPCSAEHPKLIFQVHPAP